MFLIVGLGNPGSEYVGTRHNIGFMAADAIWEHYAFSPFRSKFDGLIAEGIINGERVLLLKPQTYMNLSGNSVVKTACFYKILPENVVVIHDDMDLKICQIKAKTGGGSGGHNGLKSIDAAITPHYNRIRIGIAHPESAKGEEVVNHVLSRFGKTDCEIVQNNIKIVVDTIGVLIKEGIVAYSNKLGMLINGK